MTAADRPSVPQVGDIITTAEHLDALPSLTIVIDANDEVQQRHGHLATERGDYSAWLGVMPPTCKPSPEVALPVTVLYVPGEPSRPSVTDNARAEATPEEWEVYVATERARQRIKWGDGHDREHGPDHLLTLAIDYGRRGEAVKAAALVQATRDLLAAGRAETTTDEDAVEAAARMLYESGTGFKLTKGKPWEELTDSSRNSQRRLAQALADAGLLATARTRPTHAQVMEAIALHLGWQPGLIEAADAVLALLEGGDPS